MRELDIRKTQFTVADFLSWQREGTLNLNPRFQRRSVWKPGARSYFLDTVVRGLPAPIIYLNKMEALHASGNVSGIDVERAYGGGFLEFHAFVENSIESLFLGLLRGRLKSSDSSVRPLVRIDSDQIARRLVQAGRPYVDWMPYKEQTKRRSKYFFSSGKPFTNLDDNDLEAFRHAALIRN